MTREPLVCCEKKRPVPEKRTGRINGGASRWRGVDGVGAAMEQSATTLGTRCPHARCREQMARLSRIVQM